MTVRNIRTDRDAQAAGATVYSLEAARERRRRRMIAEAARRPTSRCRTLAEIMDVDLTPDGGDAA